jgi:flagellar protein FlgJ
MEINTTNPVSSDKTLGLEKVAKQDKLKKACADFEAIFINYMLQAMKKSLPGNELLGKSSQREMYEGMYFEKMATQIAQGKGMGIGEALYRQLDKAIGSPTITEKV